MGCGRVDNNDFLEQQRRAIERMNEMHLKQQIKTGGYKMPPTPPFVKVNNDFEKTTVVTELKNKDTSSDFKEPQEKPKNTKNFLPKQKGFSLPLLTGGGFDTDISLILGLILILANEKADRKLLLALLYILM